MEVIRVLNQGEANDWLVDYLDGIVQSRYENSRITRLAISGGETPLNLYQQLGQRTEPSYWKDTKIFWVDERFVDSADSQSNYGNAWATWLQYSKATCYPMVRAMDSISENVKTYEGLLVDEFKGQMPSFDLTLLGAGTDGHTASVFSLTDSSATENAYVKTTLHPVSRQARITLTLPVLIASQKVVLLLIGSNKKKLVVKLLDSGWVDSPVGFVVKNTPHLTIVTDCLSK